MKPYGYARVGAHAFFWSTDSPPGKPHTVTTAGDAEVSRRAGRRRPKRVERRAAREEAAAEALASERRETMTSDEKHAHPWSCDVSKGHRQCPHVYETGGGSTINCCWRAGHPPELGHQAVYDGDQSDRPWHVPARRP